MQEEQPLTEKQKIQKELAELGAKRARVEARKSAASPAPEGGQMVPKSTEGFFNGHLFKVGDKFITPEGEILTISRFEPAPDGTIRIYHTKGDDGFKLPHEVWPVKNLSEKIKLGRDPLYIDALHIAAEGTQLYTSVLQRRLRVDYERATKILDDMERDGIIDSPQVGKPRYVLWGAKSIEDFINTHEFVPGRVDSGVVEIPIEPIKPVPPPRIDGSSSAQEMDTRHANAEKARAIETLKEIIKNADRRIEENRIEEEKDRLLIESLRKELEEIRRNKKTTTPEIAAAKLPEDVRNFIDEDMERIQRGLKRWEEKNNKEMVENFKEDEKFLKSDPVNYFIRKRDLGPVGTLDYVTNDQDYIARNSEEKRRERIAHYTAEIEKFNKVIDALRAAGFTK